MIEVSSMPPQPDPLSHDLCAIIHTQKCSKYGIWRSAIFNNLGLWNDKKIFWLNNHTGHMINL